MEVRGVVVVHSLRRMLRCPSAQTHRILRQHAASTAVQQTANAVAAMAISSSSSEGMAVHSGEGTTDPETANRPGVSDIDWE
jgi:hypothetical protein